MRLCSSCRRYLDESDFYPSLKTRCKDCTKLSQRNTFAKDPVGQWFRQQISSKRSRCKKEGIKFDLDIEFLESLPRVCYYCDKALEINILNMSDKAVHIDKVIPKNGYVKSNVVLACSVCNVMKQSNDLESLEMFIKKIKKFLNIT